MQLFDSQAFAQIPGQTAMDTDRSHLPEWAQAPLREREFDVVAVFRVTADDAQAARDLVDGFATNAREVVSERGRSHIVPIYVP